MLTYELGMRVRSGVSSSIWYHFSRLGHLVVINWSWRFLDPKLLAEQLLLGGQLGHPLSAASHPEEEPSPTGRCVCDKGFERLPDCSAKAFVSWKTNMYFLPAALHALTVPL